MLTRLTGPVVGLSHQLGQGPLAAALIGEGAGLEEEEVKVAEDGCSQPHLVCVTNTPAFKVF